MNLRDIYQFLVVILMACVVTVQFAVADHDIETGETGHHSECNLCVFLSEDLDDDDVRPGLAMPFTALPIAYIVETFDEVDDLYISVSSFRVPLPRAPPFTLV